MKLHLRPPRRPSPAMVVALSSLVVAAGGVAVAATPDAKGTVSGCFSQRSGDLRVVDAEAGGTCNQRETPVRLAATDAAGKVAGADTLDGLDSSAFTRTALSTEVQRDYPATLPGECHQDAVAAGDGVADGSPVVVAASPDTDFLSFVVTGSTVQTAGEEPVSIAFWSVCNVGPYEANPGSVDLSVRVLR